MIPVVLIAGKIATPRRQTAVLASGLSIFFLSGLFSLFANSMTLLIVLGCIGGICCGLVVPVAAGAISEWFSSRPRQRDLGLKSTTSNTMVIIANVYVGWVAALNWHAAFAVYLIPIIPLCLLPFMTQKFIRSHRQVDTSAKATAQAQAVAQAPHFQGRESTVLLIMLILLYMILTNCTTSISYYAPFMMEKYGMNTTQVGLVTAAYYLMVAVSGAFVSRLKRVFGAPVMFICLALCAIGLIVIGVIRSFALMGIASLVTGFAYGIIQPVINNKTTYIAPSHQLGMTYFGYVLSSNYMAIMMVPFVDGFARHIFRSTDPGFEFIFSGCVVAVLLIWSLIERKNYVFAVNPDSAAPSEAMVAAADARRDAKH